MANGVFLVLFYVISFIVSLGMSVLFYRVVFRKLKRNRANIFSWLISIGIMFVFNTLLTVIFLEQLDLAVLAMFAIVPAMVLFAPSLWAIIRAIYIAVTKEKERNTGIKSPEPKLG